MPKYSHTASLFIPSTRRRKSIQYWSPYPHPGVTSSNPDDDARLFHRITTRPHTDMTLVATSPEEKSHSNTVLGYPYSLSEAVWPDADVFTSHQHQYATRSPGTKRKHSSSEYCTTDAESFGCDSASLADSLLKDDAGHTFATTGSWFDWPSSPISTPQDITLRPDFEFVDGYLPPTPGSPSNSLKDIVSSPAKTEIQLHSAFQDPASRSPLLQHFTPSVFDGSTASIAQPVATGSPTSESSLGIDDDDISEYWLDPIEDKQDSTPGEDEAERRRWRMIFTDASDQSLDDVIWLSKNPIDPDGKV
ncbi:Hypothetical predicted protein [Lecanosticta acicola]|uniref:Uncharacterized protein n=1 Tax=Lecanosticta acicola TaxID=111012 RepID=A0AAI8Z693_9PEZI|nr:Hypothetical predicted protein [Lecanosticta acicola]